MKLASMSKRLIIASILGIAAVSALISFSVYTDDETKSKLQAREVSKAIEKATGSLQIDDSAQITDDVSTTVSSDVATESSRDSKTIVDDGAVEEPYVGNPGDTQDDDLNRSVSVTNTDNDP